MLTRDLFHQEYGEDAGACLDFVKDAFKNFAITGEVYKHLDAKNVLDDYLGVHLKNITIAAGDPDHRADG